MAKRFGSSIGGTAATAVAIPASEHRDRRGGLVSAPHVVLHTAAEFGAEIARLWSEAQERFLEIGRYLIEAKERLPHGDFGPLVEGGLPFGSRVAQRLMQVAAAVDEGVFPQERLPPSYSTVYELVSMRPDEREAALRDGIVRPDVRRAEIIEFKRRLRAVAPSPDNRLALLRAERVRLEARLREINAEIATLEET